MKPKKYFSLEYANFPAMEKNIIMRILYKATSPISRVLANLEIQPNSITYSSILFTFAACYNLFINNLGLYSFFWALAFLADFCDGTVARMNNKVSKSLISLDHYSDIFKIFLIFLFSGIYYDDYFLWVMISISQFSFLFYTLINHEIDAAKLPYKQIKNLEIEISKRDPHRFFYVLKQLLMKLLNLLNIKIRKLLVLIDNTRFILSVNAHTLLLFFLIPINIKVAMVIFFYFAFISILGCVNLLRRARLYLSQ